MTNIVFTRVERDCPANAELRATEKLTGVKPLGITYDFQVFINGEHRATWAREFLRKGYALEDITHEDILDPERQVDWRSPWRRRITAETKDKFLQVTLANIRLIPTRADVVQRLQGEARTRLIAQDAEIEADRVLVIKDHALELHNMMTLATAPGARFGLVETPLCDLLRRIDAAVAKQAERRERIATMMERKVGIDNLVYRMLTKADIKAATYDADTGEMVPAFEAYYSAINCPNFTDTAAGRCWLAGMSVTEAGEVLCLQDEERQRDDAAIWRSERAYHDDQINH